MANNHYLVSADLEANNLPYGVEAVVHIHAESKEKAVEQYLEELLEYDSDFISDNDGFRVGVALHSGADFFVIEAAPGFRVRKEPK